MPNCSLDMYLQHYIKAPYIHVEKVHKCVTNGSIQKQKNIGVEVIKLFFILNSVEHKIFPTNKY